MNINNNKMIAIVGASDFNDVHFLTQYKSCKFSKVIAADGGFGHLKKISVLPDVVIGDFDSLGYIPRSCDDIDVIKHPCNKDKTDLELCIDNALRYNPVSIMMYGILGKRLDHEIGALQMLSKVSEEIRLVVAVGLNQSATVLKEKNELCLTASKNIDKTVSVFSLSDKSYNIYSKGFKWEYNNISLTPFMSLGISNVINGDTVKIGLQKGKLLIIYNSDIVARLN